MRNVRELRVGDLLLYDNGAVCVVCCTRNNSYKLYYVDGESSFMANTPQSLFTDVASHYIKVIRL